MLKQRDLTVRQTLVAIRKHQGILDELRETLITRAQLQEYTEEQYNALILLAKEGMEFLNSCQQGDVIGEEWIAVRDDLLGRARYLVQDAPNQ